MDVINIFLQKLESPAFTNIINFITLFGDMLGIVLVYALITLFKGEHKGLKYLSFVVINFIIYLILKLILKVERPYVRNENIKMLDWQVFSKLKGNASCPSGHTANFAFSMFYLIWEFKPKWYFILIYVILSIIMPFTRLYLGVHTILDVIIGYIIGMGVALALSRFKVYRIIKPLRNKTFQKEHTLLLMILSVFMITLFSIKGFGLSNSVFLGFLTIFPLIIYYRKKETSRRLLPFKIVNILLAFLMSSVLYIDLNIISIHISRYIVGIIFAINLIPSVIIKDSNIIREVKYEKIIIKTN